MTHGEHAYRELEENLSMRDNIESQLCDLFNGYETYPHIDGYNRGVEEGECRVIKIEIQKFVRVINPWPLKRIKER